MKNTSDRITANKKFHDDAIDYDKRNKTADEIIQNSKTLEQALSKLGDAIRRGDAKAAAQAAKEVSAMLQQQVALGRKLAEQCQDPVLRKKILDACDELERLIPLIVQATKDALLNPNDKGINLLLLSNSL